MSCTLCELKSTCHICNTGAQLQVMFVGISDDFGGDGNSFYAVGGRGNKRAQMRHCLRLMKCMTATGDENVLQDFADQGAINQLTGQSLVDITEHSHQSQLGLQLTLPHLSFLGMVVHKASCSAFSVWLHSITSTPVLFLPFLQFLPGCLSMTYFPSAFRRSC